MSSSTRILNDLAIRHAKPGNTTKSLRDGGGLFLYIKPNGSKLWRHRYQINGRRRLQGLGEYPSVSLSMARERLDAAAALLAQGKDPIAEARAAEALKRQTFADFYSEWIEIKRTGWSLSNTETVEGRMRADILPYLGGMQIHTITVHDVQSVLNRIERRGAIETARRSLAYLRGVFELAAVRTGKPHDPTFGIKAFLKKPAKVKHMAAQTDPADFARFLQAIEHYKGRNLVVPTALRLAPRLAVRPGELRKMRWADLDLEQRVWEFCASKTGQAHIVPLSDQCVGMLRELQPVSVSGEYVFPGLRNGRPLSENGLLVAIRSLGFERDEWTVHGLRAVFRTLAEEALRFPVPHIEMQLAHRVRDIHGRAYNRAQFIDERRELMQAWSDYCNQLLNCTERGNLIHAKFG